MEWNEDTINRLRAFWAEGLSTAEIGRRLGVSKNAVVGKGAPAEPDGASVADPARRGESAAPPAGQARAGGDLAGFARGDGTHAGG